MKVLLVDDSGSIRGFTASLIRDMGYEVIEADGGDAGAQMFLADPESVDLILLDVEMPGTDGFTVAQRIREAHAEWVPIIFLSGHTSDDYLEKGIEAGGDDYLHKPVSPVVLKAKMRAMARLSAMRTELKEAMERLDRLSHTDALTGLANRRAFDEGLEKFWSQARRNATCLGVLLIDIDHFKPYNDNYGHQAGDETLRRVAKALAQPIRRGSDIVARYGGEEFVVLLPDTSSEGAQKVGAELCKAVAALQIKHEYSTTADFVSISAGVVCAVPARVGGEADDLVRAADAALYVSKEAGRNRVTLGSFPAGDG